VKCAGASLRLATLGLGALLLLAALPATGDDEGDLGGFEDDEGSSSLGGFDDFDEPATDDNDDPLVQDRWWDLDGSISISNDWNFRPHNSAAPFPEGTSYLGLSRLRTRLNVQLDLELPWDFELRVSPYIWYDFTYLIRGISNFTQQVIDKYEWEGDFQDSYIQGPLLDNLDIKIGRQVVNWGRSDSLRVLDILNPLDNRTPGRADIEDLRWAVGMLKLDYYVGPWTVTAVAIPEMRFDDLPAVGNDFNPSPIPLPPKNKPNNFRDWEFAGRIRGIFEGWDLSVQAAWYFEDIPRLACDPVPSPCNVVNEARFNYDRLTQVGAGANYIWGSWLFKGEAAWLDGFQFSEVDLVVPGFGPVLIKTDRDKTSRFDGMLGVEYYGFSENTISIEAVNRYIFDHADVVFGFPVFQRENQTSYAIRWTADWRNARLQTTVLAILFGWKVQDGAVIRLQANYTIRDGLVATVGVLLFDEGELPPLDTYGKNDRVFLDLKWSF